MRLKSILVIVGCAIAHNVVLARLSATKGERGALSDLLSGNKPSLSISLAGSGSSNSANDNSRPSFLASLLNRPDKPSIFGGGINLDKPGIDWNKPSSGTPIGPTELDDQCKREYPKSPENLQQVPFAFNRYGISPKLTPPPPEYLEVEYDELRTCQPDLGNEVNVCGVDVAPTRLKWTCARDKLYTLILIDLYPLGPANPTLLSEGILWLVVDIPRCSVADGLVLYQYQQPLPLYGSGKNKYVFLVYEQPAYSVDWVEVPVVTAT